jgi:hypothetical protein
VYRVRKFSQANFYGALSTRECPGAMVQSDRHATYLFEYLNSADVAAATMIVEPEYVDRDYLEDYAAFYVTCFYKYDRFCTRIHFFNEAISRERFRKIVRGQVSGPSLKRFQEAYLGFIVVRPLPDAMIGRTQVKTYGDDGKRRHYTATRKYEVHLAGIPLSVESMAFQEQDRAVAACATVALWSCFQKTAQLFGTAAPRPPVITADATSSLYLRRALPSNGLTTEQICGAIRQNGLDPEVFPQQAITPSLIYGYLRCEIPLLMIASIESYTQQTHAIALNGYSMIGTRGGEERLYAPGPAYPGGLGTPMVGMYVNEFYGHDDQVGPFCHLFVTMPTGVNQPFTMKGEWKVQGTTTDAVITPVQIIAPLYRKIRLTFIEARAAIEKVVVFAERVLTLYGFLRDVWDWDIHLITTNDYKEDIRKNVTLSRARRDYLLVKSQPRFFWRCILRLHGEQIMEVGVDATEFTKSNPVFLVNHFEPVFAQLFVTQVKATPPGPGFHPHYREVLLEESLRK